MVYSQVDQSEIKHNSALPTAFDRVQLLLQPDEYAELSMLAKADRISLEAMGGVLSTRRSRHVLRKEGSPRQRMTLRMRL